MCSSDSTLNNSNTLSSTGNNEMRNDVRNKLKYDRRNPMPIPFENTPLAGFNNTYGHVGGNVNVIQNANTNANIQRGLLMTNKKINTIVPANRRIDANGQRFKGRINAKINANRPLLHRHINGDKRLYDRDCDIQYNEIKNWKPSLGNDESNNKGNDGDNDDSNDASGWVKAGSRRKRMGRNGGKNKIMIKSDSLIEGMSFCLEWLLHWGEFALRNIFPRNFQAILYSTYFHLTEKGIGNLSGGPASKLLSTLGDFFDRSNWFGNS